MTSLTMHPARPRPRSVERSALIRSTAHCCGLLVLLLSGCGGGIHRVEVSGRVTWDGQPLPTGAIVLHPTGTGVSAGGKIDNGNFHLTRSDGPTPGLYRVEIVSYQPTGRQLPDTDVPWSDTREELVQVIPERYNQLTELRAEVSAEGRNNFEFSLSAK